MPNQPSVADLGIVPIDKYPRDSKQKKELDKSLAKFLAQDMRPVFLITGEGFREFVKALNPKYEVSVLDYYQ